MCVTSQPREKLLYDKKKITRNGTTQIIVVFCYIELKKEVNFFTQTVINEIHN